ncbi:MAG: oxygen-independent coproporphyrinogen III oxidase-like protein [Betaproteobacteria bacterium]|nr:oxygen-independent coproporphyrinogen III oxidase-like protein [Betaproteobacteria bacterium]
MPTSPNAAPDAVSSPINSHFNKGPVLSVLPPLSLYIHIPWCVQKCPYCDFNSHESRGAIPEAQYIESLISDLDHALPGIWGRRVTSIFFGGGTPSLFSAAGIDHILSAVRARLPLDAEAEITLEANPGTVEAEKFRGFREAGINRLSIGIQSFNSTHLAALGRIHDGEEAKRAIEIAQTYFDNINLDLMYALPSQTFAECEEDLATAESFGVPHLSCYHLTLEPNTRFYLAPPPLPDDDQAADMQEMIELRLAKAGYQHYETSAYARPGRECRHNLNYWRFGDYLGIGAGAHSKISFPERITREARYKQPKVYMREAMLGLAVQEQKNVAVEELPFEFMMNALRLREGYHSALFTERTGLSTLGIARQLAKAEALGLIESDVLSGQVKPTARGRLFLNDLLTLFLAHSG